MRYDYFCHDDRLLPAESHQRGIGRELYSEIRNLPIISPHGHTDPRWFSENKNFQGLAETFIIPDHYLLRMLYSQGLELADFGVGKKGEKLQYDDRKVWRHFAKNYFLFRGTPTALWMNAVFHEVFGLDKLLTEKNADEYYDVISKALSSKDFRPYQLLKRFNIEAIATTDHAMDDLAEHKALMGQTPKVIPTFRPDRLTNPEHPEHSKEMQKLLESGKDITNFNNFLLVLRARREYFREHGATSCDHGHPDAFTCELSATEAEKLYQKIIKKDFNPEDAKIFRGYMLLKMAEMSLEDGMVMQIHTGVHRNHNPWLYENYGADMGADIPTTSEFVQNLKPLLDRFGNEKNLSLILFTLDESTYSRELAPIAGHYPAVKLGPPWWFHDSPEGMRRFREQSIETAGFYNQVGFIDDTRALFSIPARHDVARRMDASILAKWVAEHRLSLSEAKDLMKQITYEIPKRSFKL